MLSVLKSKTVEVMAGEYEDAIVRLSALVRLSSVSISKRLDAPYVGYITVHHG